MSVKKARSNQSHHVLKKEKVDKWTVDNYIWENAYIIN